jgi:CDP-diacylglycerol---glycerol-3-phosphate 3-phosphatidyltransferase
MLKLLPNILTLMRLALSFVFLAMVLYAPHLDSRTFFLDVAFVLFLVAAVTDVIDGHVARRFNATSKFGRMIDPLVDKVLVCGAFICFAIIGEPTLFGLSATALAVVHWLVVAVLLAREVTVTILRQLAEAHGVNFAATASGKFKMLLQSFAIGTVLVKMAHVTRPWGDYFTVVTFAAMVAMTVISGYLATRRPTRKPLQTEEKAHDSSSTPA